MDLNSGYPAAWAKVDSLDQQGLPKSALAEVTAIAQKARAENNSEQLLKSAVYRAKYITQLEEDGFVKAIQLLEAEEKTATQPAKAILQSMLGELYSTYLSNNGWQLHNRTPVANGEGGDILTWSADQVEKRALQYHAAALAPVELLGATPVGAFKDIIVAGKLDSSAGLPLRPTLLDLLGHRAADFFVNDRNYLNEPVYAFRLDQEAAFDNPENFVKAVFTSQDSLSGKWKAVQTYQQLTQFHLKKGATNPALLDITLFRLQFAVNNSTLSDANKRYLQALTDLHRQYAGQEGDAEVQFLRARSIYANPEGTDSKTANNLKTAASICEEAIRQYPGSYGAAQCAQLLAQINAKSLHCAIEGVQLPGKPILLSISYKNTDKIWYKIAKIDEKTSDLLQFLSFDQYALWADLPAVASGSADIKNPGDYADHRTELKIDPLTPGRYVISLFKNSNMSVENLCDFADFNCSALGIVDVSTDYQSKEFLVAHRATGAPLPNVEGVIMERRWDNGQYRTTAIGQVTTNQEGIAKLTGNYSGNQFIRFRLGDDTMVSDDYYIDNRPEQQQTSTNINFFTDRGIYRPGQTVYFKAIITTQANDQKPVIATNTPINVSLRDANGEEKQVLKLKSNEFGTVNGLFILPMGGLTGAFTLVGECNGFTTESYFNVEEYKRPKFEVSFKPAEGSYRVNEKISVSGQALNYAGDPTNGAVVKWRVVRNTFYPYRWSKWSYFFEEGSQEIAFGETTTNLDGAFEISFTALAGDGHPTATNTPVYNYEITADVTDGSGETRYGSTIVKAGFKGIVLDNGLQDENEPDSLKKISISTKNLSDLKVAVNGTLSLQPLAAPTAIFKNRVFEGPDIQTIKEADFRQFFPEYAYNKEDDPQKWAPKGSPLVYAFDSGKSDFIDLTTQNPAPGYYKATMKAKDEKGNEVVLEKIIRIKKSVGDVLEPVAIEGKTTLEPGEKASLTLASPFASSHIYTIDSRQNNRFAKAWEVINGSKTLVRTPDESDRGGFYTHWVTIYDNRVYTGSTFWNVPYTNKKLDIQFETFRDKLAPGQKEEWRIRISGPGKEKAAAELVAAMYDASLDQFYPFNWYFEPFSVFYTATNLAPVNFSRQSGGNWIPELNAGTTAPARSYPSLNWFDFPFYGGGRVMAMMSMPGEMKRSVPPMIQKDEEVAYEMADADFAAPPPPPPSPEAPGQPTPAPFRTNLKETVFFFPELRTDANGDVLVKFTMNEALTRWKLQLLAHTKDLKYGFIEKTIVTQKDIMITANAPRFLRAGDEITFSAKVSNLTDQPATGKASLALLDATTMKPAERLLGLVQPVVDFNIPAKSSSPVFWTLKVPADFTGALTWQVFADSKAGRDGEESTVPVITNRMLVTETLPLALRGNQEKTFRFDAWKNSPTRVPVRYSLEFTNNPVWYAVQSLPYLMEYPHECSEQVFSRFYANTLASSVTQKMPAIRRVYDRWKGTPALASNLNKNQELKAALLEETPWVSDAQSEEQQKQQIALLFDLNRMADEKQRALTMLRERQSANGGWPWFPGGRESWSITQHIACGLLHLERLESLDLKSDQETSAMLSKAMTFCAAAAQEHYQQLGKRVAEGNAKWEDDHLDPLVIQYLYARSFLSVERPDPVFSFYTNLIGKHWKSKGLYEQGLLALIANRTGQRDIAQSIVRSLKERALVKEELGMYWPNEWGAYWYQLPIETQALMVEVFNEVANDRTAVDDLRIWMLKNKQTNRWESTKATSEAIYALLLTGDNWLDDTQPAVITIDGKKMDVKETEPGTGYFKQQFDGASVGQPWTNIAVKNPNATIVWGAAYRQYFDDLDQITSFKKTGLTIERQVFVQKNTERGPVLTLVKDGDIIKVGDQLKVRVEVRTDRPMEFVHLKDMRPSGCEPKNVLSGYRYQGGLGYYESTRDLATHFFIDYLPRGTWVMEYQLAATHKGNMSFGISSLQCMYAPEFSSHSAGIRIKID